jgi:hypothetical protein
MMGRSDVTGPGGAPVHDLDAVFAGVSDPLYLDWVHLCERGNAMIAVRMVADVVPLLRRSPTRGRQTPPGLQATPYSSSARSGTPGSPRT